MKREEKVVKDLFGNLLYLGELFKFSKEEIIESIDKNIELLKKD